MPYFSPYHLLHLEPASPDAVDADLLRQAKRRLLADFELGEGVTVEVNGAHLDKSQALGLLEELEDEASKQHHWQVLKDPELLLLLREPGNGDLNAIPAWDSLTNQAYRAFLSPFLAEAMAAVLSEAMRIKTYYHLEEAADKAPTLMSQDVEKAFSPVHRKAKQGIEQLDQWAENPTAISRRQKELWGHIDRKFLIGLNALPNRFQSLRNRYAKSMVDLSVAISNQLRQKFLASRVIINADLLQVDVHVKSKVEHVKRQLAPGHKTSVPPKLVPPRKAGSPRKVFHHLLTGTAIVGSLLVIFFLIGLLHENRMQATRSGRLVPESNASVGLEYAIRLRLFNQLNEYAFEEKPIGIPSNVPLPEGGMHGSQPYGFVLGYDPVLPAESRCYSFHNESGRDAVVFMHAQSFERSCSHFYIAADSHYTFFSQLEGELTVSAFPGEGWENGVLPFFTTDTLVTLGAFKKSSHRLPTDHFDRDSTLVLKTKVLESRWIKGNPVAEQMGMNAEKPIVFVLRDNELVKMEK